MARVLLYNFRNEARRKKVKALLFRLALPSREVEPEEQGYPLGTLLGASGEPGESRRFRGRQRTNLLRRKCW